MSLFTTIDQQNRLLRTLRSIRSKRVQIIVYVAETKYRNCVNEMHNNTIVCNKTGLIYPVNRLRNLGLKRINGLVFDADADILPQRTPSLTNYSYYYRRFVCSSSKHFEKISSTEN